MDSNTNENNSHASSNERQSSEGHDDYLNRNPNSEATEGEEGTHPTTGTQPVAFSIGTMFIITPQANFEGGENDPFANPFQPPVKRAVKEAWDSFEPLSNDQLMDLTCPICYDDMNENDEKQATKMPCGHIFGKNCLQKWLENHCTCPLCRKEVPHETVGSAHPPILFIIPHSHTLRGNQGNTAVSQENASNGVHSDFHPSEELNNANTDGRTGVDEPARQLHRIAFNRIRFILAPNRSATNTPVENTHPENPDSNTSTPTTRSEPLAGEGASIDAENASSRQETTPSDSRPSTLTSLFNAFFSSMPDRPSSNEPMTSNLTSNSGSTTNSTSTDLPTSNLPSQNAPARPVEPSPSIQPPNLLNLPTASPESTSWLPGSQTNIPANTNRSERPFTQLMTFHGLPSLADLPAVLESMFRPSGNNNLLNLNGIFHPDHNAQTENGQTLPENNDDTNSNATSAVPNLQNLNQQNAVTMGTNTPNNGSSPAVHPVIHIYLSRPPLQPAVSEQETPSEAVSREGTRSTDATMEESSRPPSNGSFQGPGITHLSEMGQRILQRFQEEMENRMNQTRSESSTPAQQSAAGSSINVDTAGRQPSDEINIPGEYENSSEVAGSRNQTPAHSSIAVDTLSNVAVDQPAISTPSDVVGSDAGDTSKVSSGTSTPRMAAPIARRSNRHHPYSRPSSTRPQCQLEDQGICDPNDRFVHFECGHSVHERCQQSTSNSENQMDEEIGECPKCRNEEHK